MEEESDDRTIQIQQDEESNGAGQSDGALPAPASVEHSSELMGRLDQNQPDKKLSNGNICQICFFLVNDSRKGKQPAK